MKKAIVAMSGGVDSSVAALRMMEAGFSCIGVTMKLYSNEDVGESAQNTCCSLDDVEDARSVAYSLGMPYYVFNFSDRFREEVILPFIDAYRRGETPNPCIECNRHLKFETLFHRARELACDCIATGHYARTEKENGRWLLKKARDAAKDQSYVLYAMTQEQLAFTRFPLGDLTKPQVREIAAAHGFLNAKKHDSQDICFVRGQSYADFIEQYTGRTAPAGPFLDSEGNRLGTHRGVIRYTVGQRKGLGLSFGEPMYVCEILPERNAVVLGKESALYTKRLTANKINLIAADHLDAPIRVTAKTRYRQPEQPATLIQTGEDTLVAEFDTPQRAVTRGQAVVFYDGEVVVGGGTIV